MDSQHLSFAVEIRGLRAPLLVADVSQAMESVTDAFHARADL
jgi:hypothetical protein